MQIEILHFNLNWREILAILCFCYDLIIPSKMDFYSEKLINDYFYSLQLGGSSIFFYKLEYQWVIPSVIKKNGKFFNEIKTISVFL